MDSRDFLRVALEFAATNTAAGLRSATSRAYYAAYHVALELLTDLRFRIPRGHTGHEAVRDRLLHAGVDAVIHAGALLERLQGARVQADYALRNRYSEDPDNVRRWLTSAEEIIRILDAARADAASRERMTRAIREWEAARGPR